MARIKKKRDPYGEPQPQKRSSLSYNNKAIPWPVLPHRLIKLIAKNPATLQDINYGLAIKSWRSTPPIISRHNTTIVDSSELVASAIVDDTPRPPGFCGIEFRREYWSYWYERHRPYRNRYPFDHFAGISHGIVFARAASNSSELFYYFHPLDQWYGTLPGLDTPFKCAALSSAYTHSFTDRSCILMVATGISSPAFMSWGLNLRREWMWIRQDCSVAEPNYCGFGKKTTDSTNRLMSFTNMIGFKGKFYALSSQGTLAVIELVGNGDSDDRFEITALGKTRAVPSLPFRVFKEGLMESNGELLLVFLASIGTTKTFDFVEVFWLRFDDLSWIKMESLGERTLFIGNDCCLSVQAEKVGCRVNCVYFMQRGVDVWFEFDMRFGSISRAWTDRDSSSTGNPLEWDEPVIGKEDLV